MSDSQPLFHCGICHEDFRDLAAHKREHHAGSFPMKNGCEIQQCPKWKREHPTA